MNLQKEHERWLAEEEFNQTPVFVTHYPRDLKAFYMRQSEADARTVDAVDLLVPSIGELIGGSAREERHDVRVLITLLRYLELEKRNELQNVLTLGHHSPRAELSLSSLTATCSTSCGACKS